MKSYNIGHISVGHACWSPTTLDQTPVSKVSIEGKLAGVVSATHIGHICILGHHPRPTRAISGGSSKVSVEGNFSARTGDPIACGDTCGQGSSVVSIG